MDANIRLEGEKVFLTPMQLDDAEDFVRWRNSDLIKSKFIYRKDITVEQQRQWISTKVLTDEVVQFVIWDKQDNKKIGSVYLQHIDKENKKCEFGILIGEEAYLGGGRGTEANNLICEYGFNQMDMHKIYLRVLAENIPARRSYTRAGFTEEYKSHDDVWVEGQPEDVVFMSKYSDGSTN